MLHSIIDLIDFEEQIRLDFNKINFLAMSQPTIGLPVSIYRYQIEYNTID